MTFIRSGCVECANASSALARSEKSVAGGETSVQGQVIRVFVSSDDPEDTVPKAKALVAKLKAKGYEAHLHDKQGFDLEDLRKVATYQVLYTPSVLLFKEDTLCARVTRILSFTQIRRLFRLSTPVG
jgi:hypothetical protein